MNAREKELKGFKRIDKIQGELTRLSLQRSRYKLNGNTFQAEWISPDITKLRTKLKDSIEAHIHYVHLFCSFTSL